MQSGYFTLSSGAAFATPYFCQRHAQPIRSLLLRGRSSYASQRGRQRLMLLSFANACSEELNMEAEKEFGPSASNKILIMGAEKDLRWSLFTKEAG